MRGKFSFVALFAGVLALAACGSPAVSEPVEVHGFWQTAGAPEAREKVLVLCAALKTSLDEDRSHPDGRAVMTCRDDLDGGDVAAILIGGQAFRTLYRFDLTPHTDGTMVKITRFIVTSTSTHEAHRHSLLDDARLALIDSGAEDVREYPDRPAQ